MPNWDRNDYPMKMRVISRAWDKKPMVNNYLCKFILEVLGADVCDPTTLIYAYVIFPNCKLSSTVEIGLATDSGMPFELTAAQAYCDKEKKLFQIVVPNPDEE